VSERVLGKRNFSKARSLKRKKSGFKKRKEKKELAASASARLAVL